MVDVASPTAGYQCELNESLVEILINIAMRTLYASDGKGENANTYNSIAYTMINALNGTTQADPTAEYIDRGEKQ